MDMLKKYFPKSFGINDVAKLIIAIVIYVVIDIVAGAVVALATLILPILGVIFGLVGSLVGLYTLVGIVLAILDFCKVLK